MTSTDYVVPPDGASSASGGAVSWLARTIDAVVANGWAPLPIAPGTKMPGSPTWHSHRRPDGEGRSTELRISTWQGLKRWPIVKATPENVAEWKSWGPDVGLGIRCDDVVGIDIDVTNEDEAAAVEALTVEILGPTPLRRVGKHPKVALYYRQAEPMYKSVPARQQDKGGYALEYFAKGSQMLAFAIHPDTKAHYSCGDATPTNTRVIDLPVVTKEQLDELGRRVGERWGVKAEQVQVGPYQPTFMKPLPLDVPPTADPVFAELNRRGLIKSGPNEEGWTSQYAHRARSTAMTAKLPSIGRGGQGASSVSITTAKVSIEGTSSSGSGATRRPMAWGPTCAICPRPSYCRRRVSNSSAGSWGRSAQDGGSGDAEDDADAVIVADSRPRILLLSGRRRDAMKFIAGILERADRAATVDTGGAGLRQRLARGGGAARGRGAARRSGAARDPDGEGQDPRHDTRFRGLAAHRAVGSDRLPKEPAGERQRCKTPSRAVFDRPAAGYCRRHPCVRPAARGAPRTEGRHRHADDEAGRDTADGARA